MYNKISSFQLKIIAIISMTLDHIGYHNNIAVFRYVGRIALPVFCYLIAFGFKKTNDPFKYLLRLLIFFLIVQIPFSIASSYMNINHSYFNIFLTLALGLLSLIIDKKNKYLSLLYLVLIAFIDNFLLKDLIGISIEYGIYGILMIYIFGKFDDFIGYIYIIVTSIIFYLGYIYETTIILPPFQSFAVLSIIFISMLNKDIYYKPNNFIKYGLYLYYPLHVIIIILLSS